jgi:hypothetical protein
MMSLSDTPPAGITHPVRLAVIYLRYASAAMLTERKAAQAVIPLEMPSYHP